MFFDRAPANLHTLLPLANAPVSEGSSQWLSQLAWLLHTLFM
jgi:hypothetical protein